MKMVTPEWFRDLYRDPADQGEMIESSLNERRDAVLNGYTGPGDNANVVTAQATAEEAITAFRAHYAKAGETVEITGVSPGTVMGAGVRQNVWLPVTSSLGQALTVLRAENGKLRRTVDALAAEIALIKEDLKATKVELTLTMGVTAKQAETVVKQAEMIAERDTQIAELEAAARDASGDNKGLE